MTIIAPALEQSGVAHAITLLTPLVVKTVDDEDGSNLGWMVEGSPADSVKLGICELMSRPPDLIVSGINSGSNAGINVLYSGTVAAAIEGAFFKITSVAISLELSERFDYPYAAAYAVRVIKKLLRTNRQTAHCLISTYQRILEVSPRVFGLFRWAWADMVKALNAVKTHVAGLITG